MGNNQNSGLSSQTAHSQTTQSQTTQPQTTQPQTVASSHVPGEWVDEHNQPGIAQSNPENQGSHLGRDAAAIGIAGAVGEGIYQHRQKQPGVEESITSSSQTSGQLGPNNISTGYNNNGPSENTASSHHLGRDVTAAGTAGAVAEGIHHHYQHNGTAYNDTVPGSNTSSGQRLGGDATHPGHTQHNLGRDIAAVGTTGAVGEGIRHHHQHGGTAYNDTVPGSNTSSGQRLGTGVESTSSTTDPATGSAVDSKDHHYGRDAGLGAGALGAVGLASQ